MRCVYVSLHVCRIDRGWFFFTFSLMRLFSSRFISVASGPRRPPPAHSKSPRLTMYHKQVTSGLSPDAISNDNGQSSTTSAASSNLSSTLTNSTTASSGPDASGSSYAEGPTLTQTPSPTTVRDFASPGLGRGRMRVQGDIVNTKALRQPLTFAFSGRTAMNRLLKAPMTERLCRWNREGEDIVRASPFLQFPSQLAILSPQLSILTSLLPPFPSSPCP